MDDVLSGVGSGASGSSGRVSSSQTKIEIDKLIKAVVNSSNSVDDTAIHLQKVLVNTVRSLTVILILII